MEYKYSYVAYLDILGFKDLSNDSANVDFIYNLYEHLFSIKSDSKLYSIFEKIKVSILSDNVIVSCKIGIDNLYEFCKYIIYIQRQLIDINVYFRGGIVCGEVFQNKIECFGPALVKAYLMEKELSIYPRVLIDNELVKNFYNRSNEILSCSDTPYVKYEDFGNDFDSDFDVKLNYKYLFIRDLDGLYYLNLFNFFYDILIDDSVLTTIGCLRKNIIKNLEEYNKPEKRKIFQKYFWMKNKFNENLVNLKNELRNNPSICNEIPFGISNEEFNN